MQGKNTLPERLRTKITERPDGCWEWTASRTRQGYGRVRWDGGHASAHRVVYALLVAPIPDDLTVDHLCRNRWCVNPVHMEIVTLRENILRGDGVGVRNAAKTLDHVRKTVTVFAKGGTVRTLPVPDPAFWHDLERLILDSQAEPAHFLMPGRRGNRHGSRLLPDTQISNHALHDWWYRCLERAGVVAEGTTSGERMHKARHTAGQRVLDATGNLKAVQKLLGHASMLTTADVYLDWDLDALAQSMVKVLEEES